MASVKRIKRRLLREAVAENVSTMRGGRWARAKHKTWLDKLGRTSFLVGTPVALFFSSFLLAQATTQWMRGRRVEPGSAIVVPQASPRPIAATTDAAGRRWMVPTSIDHSVLPLTVRRVIVDPGHGGVNRGTASASGKLVEKEITLDVARRLERLLESNGYEAVMTRTSDETVSLEERGEHANLASGDVFLSIHVNWFKDPAVRGFETFYLGPTDDPYLEQLAALENQHSELRIADFREALERVYAGVRQEESGALASAVQRQLLMSLRAIDPAVENRGVKTAPFGVLIRTEMPAILVELGFLSNDDEAQLLSQDSYRQYLAESLFAGLNAYTVGLEQAGATTGS